jgi:IS5 family transposase
MRLVGIWNGGLSDENVEEQANSNLHVMKFLGLSMEEDVPVHSVLSRFRSALTNASAWDELLEEINTQLSSDKVTVTSGHHVDASITHSPRAPNTKPGYEVVSDREERDDEAQAKTDMQVVEAQQPGVDHEARWLKKAGKSVFGYKQHTMVDDNGLVDALITTAANQHDSIPFIELVDKAQLPKGSRVHTDKAYDSQKHDTALKENVALKTASRIKRLKTNR